MRELVGWFVVKIFRYFLVWVNMWINIIWVYKGKLENYLLVIDNDDDLWDMDMLLLVWCRCGFKVW